MNYEVDTEQTKRQTEWVMSDTILYGPAFPCGSVNVQHVPSFLLDRRAVDIESALFGINENVVYPTPAPKAKRIVQPSVEFNPARPVYIPILPALDRHQRPTL